MAIGASEEPREASMRRWKAGALPPAAVLCRLMPAGERTGAVGVSHWVASRSSGPPQAAQPVSTKALGEVHRRMTTRIGAPQVGQRAARCRGLARCRLALAGVALDNHQADGRERDGTAG